LSGNDAGARAALERFCGALGAFAGDAALIHGARCVVIAGGIVPRFVPFLRESAFLERFRAKGRYARRMENVAIRVLTHPVPGLVGAAAALAAVQEPAA
jgi:glucokinase